MFRPRCQCPEVHRSDRYPKDSGGIRLVESLAPRFWVTTCCLGHSFSSSCLFSPLCTPRIGKVKLTDVSRCIVIVIDKASVHLHFYRSSPQEMRASQKWAASVFKYRGMKRFSLCYDDCFSTAKAFFSPFLLGSMIAAHIITSETFSMLAASHQKPRHVAYLDSG
jgi:hypothetical protein